MIPCGDWKAREVESYSDRGVLTPSGYLLSVQLVAIRASRQTVLCAHYKKLVQTIRRSHKLFNYMTRRN
jgi:hypothetical protein